MTMKDVAFSIAMASFIVLVVLAIRHPDVAFTFFWEFLGGLAAVKG